MKKIVIFDFDGVIVDSFDQSFLTIKHLNPNTTKNNYRKSYEDNIYNNIKELSNLSVNGLKKTYQQHYLKKVNNIKLFKKLDKIIKKLAEKYILTIVSSSSIDIINTILERENLRKHFHLILDGYESHNSKVKKFETMIKQLKRKKKECLFVTDTLGDLKEAAEAGIPAIAVSWGYHDKNLLSTGKQQAIVNDPEEILEKVDLFFSK